MTFYGKTAARLLAALLLAGSLGTAASAARYDGDMGLYEGGPFNGAALKLDEKNLPPAPSTVTTSAEVTGFWEKLRTGTIEPACRKVEVKFNKDMHFAAGVVGIGGGAKRAIRRFPDGNLALVDEVSLKTSIGISKQLISLPQVEGFGLSVGLSGSLEGKSQVVQPTEKRKLCGELLDIAKFWEFKTVVPATLKRVKNMEVGEIWKLPMSMTMSFSVAASANIEQMVTVGVSYGHTKQAKPSITLRRLEKNMLRLRLRLDRISVNSFGASASTVELPLDLFGLEKAGTMTADILNKHVVPTFAEKWVTPSIFDKLLKSEINKYLSFKMSFSHSRYSGKKLLMEFILDPENEEHMKLLDQFLTGDFGILTQFFKAGMKFNKFSEDDDADYGLDALQAASSSTAVGDGVSSFTGTDIYHGRSNSFGANLPIAGSPSVSWGSSYHRYQSDSYGGETIHVHQRTKSYNGSYLNVPFMGTIFKHNSQRDVLVLNKENTNGEVTAPVLLYQQMDGVVNNGAGAPGRMLEKANGMLRYVGTNGQGTSDANQIPLSDVTGNSRWYTSGMVSVKMLISEGGVQDIIKAPAETVMKAFMNMMREAYSEILDKVMHLFYIDKKGKVAYDRTTAAAILQLSAEDLDDAMNPLNIIDSLVYDATRFIKDIVSVREAGDWKAQSQRLSDVAAGKGKSGMRYEDFFKVVLQLVKPQDVQAQVYVYMNPKKKGEADVVKSYDFFGSEGRNYDNTLSGVNQMRERFADPTELSD